MTNRNAQLEVLAKIAESGTCTICERPIQVVRNPIIGYKLSCRCETGPWIASRETQAKWIERQRKEMTDGRN